MKEPLTIVCVALLGMLAGCLLQRCCGRCDDITSGRQCNEGGGLIVKRDTVMIYDTLRVDSPRVVSDVKDGYKRFDIADVLNISEDEDAGSENEATGLCSDSGEIELKMVHRHYADSTYEAWVSGPVDPRLDSLRIYARERIVTEREYRPRKRWHIGPTIGYGYGQRGGFDAFVGVSLIYSIISF